MWLFLSGKERLIRTPRLGIAAASRPSAILMEEERKKIREFEDLLSVPKLSGVAKRVKGHSDHPELRPHAS